jgi:hypothetical protein
MDEDTRLAVDNLRAHFELIVASAEKRWETVEKAHEQALKVAYESNDKRFAALNGFREAMADQSSRMLTRQEAESNHHALLEKIESHRSAMENRVEAEVRPMQARLEEVGRPNWALMTSMASAAFLVVAAVWMIIGLKIDATMSPLALELTQLRTASGVALERITALNTLATSSTAADAASRADREQLNSRVRVVESSAAQRRTDLSVLDARMVEIETQFCARDNIANLMHAFDLRLFAMMWAKTFPGSVYPTDNAFYPKVCNQNVTANQHMEQLP